MPRTKADYIDRLMYTPRMFKDNENTATNQFANDVFRAGLSKKMSGLKLVPGSRGHSSRVISRRRFLEYPVVVKQDRSHKKLSTKKRSARGMLLDLRRTSKPENTFAKPNYLQLLRPDKYDVTGVDAPPYHEAYAKLFAKKLSSRPKQLLKSWKKQGLIR